MTYGIELTGGAQEDLMAYSAFERTALVRGLRQHLESEPTVPTRKRKLLRAATLSRWELRLGKHRVFYDVDEGARRVKVIAIGHKEHNALYIRGQEVSL